MNELEKIEQLTNILNKKVNIAKQFKLVTVTIDLSVAEEMVDILNDSIRTIKEYDAEPFDHSLPVPPRRLN